LGIGDWGLGIGGLAQSPIPNPQSPIPIHFINFKPLNFIKFFIKFLKLAIENKKIFTYNK